MIDRDSVMITQMVDATMGIGYAVLGFVLVGVVALALEMKKMREHL